MKNPSPWSVKGIDAKTRALAKAAAQERGMTLGQWLNQMIEAGSADPQDAELATDSKANAGSSSTDGAPPSGSTNANDDAQPIAAHDGEGVADSLDSELDAISAQIERTTDPSATSGLDISPLLDNEPMIEFGGNGLSVSAPALDENQSAAVSAGSDGSTESESPRELFLRLESTERRIDAQIDGLSQRLASISSAEPRIGTDSLAKLEGAVNSVVDHIALTDRRNSQLLHTMQERVAGISDRIAEIPAGNDQKAEIDSALSELRGQLDTIRSQVSDTAHASKNAADAADSASSKTQDHYARLNGRMIELGDSIKVLESKLDQVNPSHETIADHPVVQALDRRLVDLTQRINQRLEAAASPATRNLEEKIARLERNQESIDTDSIDRRLGALAALLDDHAQLTEGHVNDHAAAINRIDEDIEAVREHLNSSESSNDTAILADATGQLEADLAQLRDELDALRVTSNFDTTESQLEEQAQQLSDLSDELDQVRRNIGNGTLQGSDIESIFGRLDGADSSISEILNAWDAVAERINDFETRMTSLNEASTQRVRYEEFERLETKLNTLDEEIRSGQLGGSDTFTVTDQIDDVLERIGTKAEAIEVADLGQRLESVSDFVSTISRRVGVDGSGSDDDNLGARIDALTAKLDDIATTSTTGDELEALRQRVEATIRAFDELGQQPDSVAYFAHQMNDLTHRVKAAESRYMNMDSLEQTVGQLFEHIGDVRKHATAAAERASDRAVAKMIAQISTTGADGTQLQVVAPAAADIAEALADSEGRTSAIVNRLQDVVQELAERSHRTEAGSKEEVGKLRDAVTEMSAQFQTVADRAEALERVAIARGAITSTSYHQGVDTVSQPPALVREEGESVVSGEDYISAVRRSQRDTTNTSGNTGRSTAASQWHAANDDLTRRRVGWAAAVIGVAGVMAWTLGTFSTPTPETTVAEAALNDGNGQRSAPLTTASIPRTPIQDARSLTDITGGNLGVAPPTITRELPRGDRLAATNSAPQASSQIITSSTDPITSLDGTAESAPFSGNAIASLTDPTRPGLESLAAALPPAGTGPLGLRIAAFAGEANAQYTVGQAFLTGNGVDKNPESAAYWIRHAANSGLPIAMYQLALQYESGNGVPKDAKKALALYRRAAQAGNVKAMHGYGMLLADGSGGTADRSGAAQWFERAARHGLTASQFNLGIMYDRGLGVRRDWGEAFKWYALAELNGDKESSQFGRAARKRLTDAEVEMVAREVGEFKARTARAQANEVSLPPGGWDNFSAQEGGATLAQRQMIARAQRLLKSLGYNVGGTDGVYGDRTENALRAFTNEIGLGETGRLTPAILTLLVEAEKAVKREG